VTPAQIAAVRWQLDVAHRNIDHEFAEVRSLLARLEREWRAEQKEREAERLHRMTNAELATLAGKR
jgi:hypothetical protein